MRKGISLIEVLLVISILALLIGILLPALGASRRTASGMQQNTQTRGIQSALVLYANTNLGYYVGVDSTGNIIDASVEGRFQTLLEESYFTPEYIISPMEVLEVWTTGQLHSNQYSYALLAISQPIQPQAQVPQRLHEWRDTINPEAPVVSDRNAGGPTPAEYQSVWTTEPGDWRASVGWNDNHVTFEATAVGLKTKYGQHANNNDDLFAPDGPADAFMIHIGE